MNPDISYRLNFDSSQRKQVIESLGKFCVNTENGGFNSAFISDDCSISFKVDFEETLKWYYEFYEFSKQIKGKIIIGKMQLWIKEEENETVFEFWAPTSSIGKACMDSKKLFKELVKLVKDNGGYEIQIDYSNGFIETIYKNK